MNIARYCGLGVAVACFAATHSSPADTPTFVFTAASRYDAEAWTRGQERFPAGASLRLISPAGTRRLAPGFFASADPEVSFDGQRVLFSARPRRDDPWQIWEISVASTAVRRIAAQPEDCIRPLYLPDERVVYARKTAQGFQLEVQPLAGGTPQRITYSPQNFLPADVLHDGRILFETVRDLFTVYPDGSGVESYRCDHGPARRGARQVASRDVVFTTADGLARFTSALAIQTPVATAPRSGFAGPVAELGPDEWLISFRPSPGDSYAIYRRSLVAGEMRKVSDGPGVQPVLLVPREVPLRFPSGLHDWDGANLLCLNAYTSKTKIAADSIATVRLYSQDALLGETPVEADGSYFLHVPSEQPLRLELRDRGGRIIAAEHGSFWMRRGEQRACVGCHAGPERTPENAVPQVLLRSDVPVTMRLPVHTAGGSR